MPAPQQKGAFITRRGALAAPAERVGLTPLGDPPPKEGDARCPPVPLTAPWYMEHRLDEQMRYYPKGQAENEQAAARLRTISFASAIIAAILGVAGSNFAQERFAPWIGVMTTITVAVMAYGLLDRRQIWRLPTAHWRRGYPASRRCSRSRRSISPCS